MNCIESLSVSLSRTIYTSTVCVVWVYIHQHHLFGVRTIYTSTTYLVFRQHHLSGVQHPYLVHIWCSDYIQQHHLTGARTKYTSIIFQVIRLYTTDPSILNLVVLPCLLWLWPFYTLCTGRVRVVTATLRNTGFWNRFVRGKVGNRVALRIGSVSTWK